MTKYLLLIASLTFLMPITGCVGTKPYVVEFYPPVTPAEKAMGHGAYKRLDYRKPRGTVTIFGFSLF